MIILAIAALFVLYALYVFFIAKPADKKKGTETKPVEISSYVNTLTSDLTKNRVTDVDVYIAKKAEMEWTNNPFWERSSYREFAGKEAGRGASKIVYSGYVDAGRKKMAVINGTEYEVGESIEIEGYVLETVTPSSILIKNRNTGGELYVPIQEE